VPQDMKILITAGPTHEPIDPVRYIGNRSSGQMGAALASAAHTAGHAVTLILGPVTFPMPPAARRIDVQTAAEMHAVVLREFPSHHLLIMAAAVADYRPRQVHRDKLPRQGVLTIECEPTEDIVAAAAASKRSDQRIIGFSLESAGDINRAREKLARKHLDLIVYNPTDTMSSATIEATLLWPDGRDESLGARPKQAFAQILLDRATAMFAASKTTDRAGSND
jgi:phosphopantothenoylcysteine decarboxylase/phosphopantothenate--cysteine ligase